MRGLRTIKECGGVDADGNPEVATGRNFHYARARNMKYPHYQIAAVLTVSLVFPSCASKRTETWSSKRDDMMQHFAGNFEYSKTEKDSRGKPLASSDRRSAFENKSYHGTKDFRTKSYGKKEFGTKEFGTKEFGRDSYQFEGERNVSKAESSLASQRFAEAGKVADTEKTLFDRNKEIAHTPFSGADKTARTKAYYPAEKSQKEGDGEWKGVVQDYKRDGSPITFSDIKSMLNRGIE